MIYKFGCVYCCASQICTWCQWHHRVNGWVRNNRLCILYNGFGQIYSIAVTRSSGLALHPTSRVRLTRYVLTASPVRRSPNQRDANSVTLYSELKYKTPAHCLSDATLLASFTDSFLGVVVSLIAFLGSHCLSR